MSDETLRDLERETFADPSWELLERLAIARARVGRPELRRLLFLGGRIPVRLRRSARIYLIGRRNPVPPPGLQRAIGRLQALLDADRASIDRLLSRIPDARRIVDLVRSLPEPPLFPNGGRAYAISTGWAERNATKKRAKENRASRTVLCLFFPARRLGDFACSLCRRVVSTGDPSAVRDVCPVRSPPRAIPSIFEDPKP